MNSRKSWLTLVALALMPIASKAQVSPLDAQSLPLPELAQKALGAAGSLMIDVERPTWGDLPRLMPPPPSTDWPSSGPPPLDSLRFFGRGVVTGSQFGMCGSDWVTVNFEDGGRVESLEAQRRYGVEGQIYREPGEWTYEESEKICNAAKTTRTYFPAPDAESALDIAWYVDAIAGRGPFAKQDFTFQCEGLCGKGRSELQSLQLSQIDQARIVDCDPTKLKLPSCYELVVGENEIGPFPKTFRIYGSSYMNKVVITAVKVNVGSTVE